MKLKVKLKLIESDLLRIIDKSIPNTFSHQVPYGSTYAYNIPDKIYAFLCQVSADLSVDKNDKESFFTKKKEINEKLKLLSEKQSKEFAFFSKVTESQQNNTDYREMIERHEREQLEVTNFDDFDFDRQIVFTAKNLLKPLLISLIKESEDLISELEKMENGFSESFFLKIFVNIDNNFKQTKQIDYYLQENYKTLKEKLLSQLTNNNFWKNFIRTFATSSAVRFLPLPPQLKFLLVLGTSFYSLIQDYQKKTNLATFLNCIFDLYLLDFLNKNNFSNKKSNSENISFAENCYRILGVDKSISAEELKKKYNELIKIYHPDKIQHKDIPKEIMELTENKFKEIVEAYNYLKNFHNL